MAFTLDTDAFFSALLRFEQRRGTPAVYYSDNGTKSTGAQPESKDCLAHLDSSNIKDKLAKRLIEWHRVALPELHALVVHGRAWQN